MQMSPAVAAKDTSQVQMPAYVPVVRPSCGSVVTHRRVPAIASSQRRTQVKPQRRTRRVGVPHPTWVNLRPQFTRRG